MDHDNELKKRTSKRNRNKSVDSLRPARLRKWKKGKNRKKRKRVVGARARIRSHRLDVLAARPAERLIGIERKKAVSGKKKNKYQCKKRLLRTTSALKHNNRRKRIKGVLWKSIMQQKQLKSGKWPATSNSSKMRKIGDKKDSEGACKRRLKKPYRGTNFVPPCPKKETVANALDEK